MLNSMFGHLFDMYLFGILLTIIVFAICSKICAKIKFPLFNPILLSIIFIIIILKLTNVPYEKYYIGGSILNALIVPATVSLAIPLHKNFHLLKQHYTSIITGILLGNIINCIIIAVVAKVLKYKPEIVSSMLPKSVTTAIAVGVSENLGGIASITVVVVMVTGITGAVLGPFIFDKLNIKDHIAIGISLGSASHAVGTSKALEMNTVSGAMAGLAVGITGIFVIFIIPLVIRLV